MSYLDDKTQRSNLLRQLSVRSVDTSASGVAESTISLGLGRFPEPPSSIPQTPILSNSALSSPVHSTHRGGSTTPTRASNHPGRSPYPPTTFTRYAESNQSFKHPHPLPRVPSLPGEQTSSFKSSPSDRVLTGHDWHDGASSIDVDDAEDSLLPTSLITSLLRENRPKRTSYASEAFSGISELTYPPNRAVADASVIGSNFNMKAPPPYNPSPLRPSRTDSPAGISSKRMSGDSETLHSVQGYSYVTRPQGGQPAMSALGSTSGASRTSSTVDSDTIRSGDKDYHRRLPTTYESDDEVAQWKDYDRPQYVGSTSDIQASSRIKQSSSMKDRASIHSSKSAAPTFMSRVSGFSLKKVFRKKPLPPVPTIPKIPLSVKRSVRRQDDETPLPDLLQRAGALRQMLDEGHHPHQSFQSSRSPHKNLETMYGSYDPREPKSDSESTPFSSQQASLSHRQTYRPSHTSSTASLGDNRFSSAPLTESWSLRSILNPRRRICIIVTMFIIVALAAIGVGVGISVGKKSSQEFNCTNNMTGSACSLDATCVCTSTAQCNGLAQSVVDTIEPMNSAFKMNFTTGSAYSNLWLLQGGTAGSTSNCAQQALLMDVGTALDQAAFPQRTEWAKSALLWNALQTQDPDGVQTMRKAVQNLPWQVLRGNDGPNSEASGFSIISAGFTFDFASQTVTIPDGSYSQLSQAPKSQSNKLSAVAQATLDRMYTFAHASSTQRQSALQRYWASTLHQRPGDLAIFKDAFLTSPILLPFNASSPAIRNLYTTSFFPPPLSCFPNLTTAMHDRLSSFESDVFNLPSQPIASRFEPSCYRDRPVYGVLDVLHLRLPFLDTRNGVVHEAVALNAESRSRAVVYNGEIFSHMPTNPAIPSLLEDPRQYGALSIGNYDHIVLQYLTSISSIANANAVVKFILESATAAKTPIPPTPSSSLFEVLPSLPVLEVAVFGDITLPDLSATVARFSASSGSLLFGSADGTALRNFTIDIIKRPVIWTENATSPLVVRDDTLGSENAVTLTWNAISLAIANNVPNIGLPNITSTLTRTRNFVP